MIPESFMITLMLSISGPLTSFGTILSARRKRQQKNGKPSSWIWLPDTLEDTSKLRTEDKLSRADSVGNHTLENRCRFRLTPPARMLQLSEFSSTLKQRTVA